MSCLVTLLTVTMRQRQSMATHSGLRQVFISTAMNLAPSCWSYIFIHTSILAPLHPFTQPLLLTVHLNPALQLPDILPPFTLTTCSLKSLVRDWVSSCRRPPVLSKEVNMSCIQTSTHALQSDPSQRSLNRTPNLPLHQHQPALRPLCQVTTYPKTHKHLPAV